MLQMVIITMEAIIIVTTMKEGNIKRDVNLNTHIHLVHQDLTVIHNLGGSHCRYLFLLLSKQEK